MPGSTEYKGASSIYELLVNLSIAITSSHNIEEAVNEAIARISKALDFPFADAWIINYEKQALEMIAFYADPSKETGLFTTETNKITFAKGEGLPGMAWKTKNSVWANRLTEQPFFARKDAAKQAGIKTGIAIPIPLDGEVTGVVGFYFTEEEPENKDLIRLLTAIAGQLGIVLKHTLSKDELKRSELRYRNIVEAAPESIITFNSSGKIEDVNSFTQKLFDYTREELVGKPWQVILASGEQDIQFLTERLKEKKSIETTDYLAMKKDGTTFPVEMAIVSVDVKTEEFYSCILRDLSEKKEVELLRSRLINIIESSEDAIFSKDLEGRILTWNNGSEKITGYSRKEVIGTVAANLLAPGFEADAKEILEQVMSGKKVHHFETRLLHKQGHEVLVSLTVSPMYGKERTLEAISIIARDITLQKEAEALRSRLASIVEESDDAIISRTLDGTIVTWNPASERIFGYTANEVVGGPKSILFPLDLREEETRLINKIKRGERIKNFESVRVRKDGKMINVSLTISPIKTASGEIIGASTIARDITDRVKIEAERNAILENVQAGIAACDSNGTLTFFNEVARKFHNLPEMSISADEWAMRYNLYHPDGKTLMKKEEIPLYRALVNGSVKNAEMVIRSTDGISRYILAEGHAIFDKSGRKMGAVVAMHDISDRKKVEEQLRQSEEKYRVVINNIKEVVFQAEAEGKWVFLNPAWTDITGFTLEESYGKPVTEFVHEEDRELSTRYYHTLISGEKEHITYEVRFRTKSGSFKWIEVAARVMHGSDNSILGTTGILRDVTLKREAEESIREKSFQLQHMNEELTRQIEERKFFERQLENAYADLEQRVFERTRELSLSEERFRLLGDMIPHIVWTAGPDGSIDYYNKKLDDYTGFTFSETVGTGWLDLIHDDDRPRTIEEWQEAVSTGEMFEAEYRLKRKDGQYRWFLARALPLRDGKNIVKWFGSATDIHDQKMLEEKKDEFIGIASHELKTPLTSIKAYMQLLQTMVPEGSTLKNYVKKTNGFVDKLNGLITELLDVSKIQAGKLQFNMEQIDLSVLVRESVESVQHSSTTHKIIIEDDLPIRKVTGDKMRLEQVLINFLTNAVKYSPQANKVIVKAWEEDDRVIVSVRDFGLGIPRENQKKIFDRFYRVEGLSPHISGLGIGLYIASEIVRRHKGKVWVESEEGKGSTFYFCLPFSGSDWPQE